MNLSIKCLCEHSGNMARPWAMFGGCKCVCYDIKNDDTTVYYEGGGSIEYSSQNVLHPAIYTRNCVVFAFPPCTHLASSGAAWFKRKGLKALIDGLTLVERCRELGEQGLMYMLENPIGTLSTYWRKPDYTFQPCDYAGYLEGAEKSPIARDAYTKRTCLWTSDNFIIPEPKPVAAVKGSMMRDTISDQEERSIFPLSFSLAVYEANKHLCQNS